MRSSSSYRLELKLRYLMPAFLVFGGVINFTVTSPPDLELPALRGLPLRSSIAANYGVDSPTLIFPLVDPDIILDVNKDAAAAAVAAAPSITPTPVAGATGTPQASPTPGLPLPTIGITLPPLVSTDVPAIINTAVGPVINTVVAPINTLAAPVNTVVAPVATAVAPITNPVQTLVPVCIPIPLIRTCP